jgi:hypothetical protein
VREECFQLSKVRSFAIHLQRIGREKKNIYIAEISVKTEIYHAVPHKKNTTQDSGKFSTYSFIVYSTKERKPKLPVVE